MRLMLIFFAALFIAAALIVGFIWLFAAIAKAAAGM